MTLHDLLCALSPSRSIQSIVPFPLMLWQSCGIPSKFCLNRPKRKPFSTRRHLFLLQVTPEKVSAFRLQREMLINQQTLQSKYGEELPCKCMGWPSFHTATRLLLDAPNKKTPLDESRAFRKCFRNFHKINSAKICIKNTCAMVKSGYIGDGLIPPEK